MVGGVGVHWLTFKVRDGHCSRQASLASASFTGEDKNLISFQCKSMEPDFSPSRFGPFLFAQVQVAQVQVAQVQVAQVQVAGM